MVVRMLAGQNVTPRPAVRHRVLRPYRQGPCFSLKVWSRGHSAHDNRWVLGYELRQCENGTSTVLFTGEDFAHPYPRPWSPEALEVLLLFLCLRPGDTDAEYFEHHTPAQLEFCRRHAEALASEVERRYGAVC